MPDGGWAVTLRQVSGFRELPTNVLSRDIVDMVSRLRTFSWVRG